MARIGLLSLSDGRDYVHRDVRGFIEAASEGVAASMRAAGHEVVTAPEVVWTNELATSQARWLADQRVDLTVFHYAVWAFPHFTMLAADATPGPLLLLAISIRSTRAWSACWPVAVRSTRSAASHARVWGDVTDARTMTGCCRRSAPRRLRDPAGLHLWSHRGPADGDVHRRRQHRPVDAPSSASTSRRSTSGRSSAGLPTPTSKSDGRPGVAGEERAPSTTTASSSPPNSLSARSAPTTRCGS